ncbi:MAG: 4Fe-4S ferredoxin [Flavobacteriia bacterium]|nr:MAG: 4Fe-4S ferredoxin [Flavobacteriia bacterium]
MLIISLQRGKCIGCNFCEEVSPEQFRMSKKDGKAVLLNARERKGFHTVKLFDESLYEANLKAQEGCPSKIIQVKLT